MRTDGIPHVRTFYPTYYKLKTSGVKCADMSAHLYYENCPSATVLCGVVFPGADRFLDTILYWKIYGNKFILPFYLFSPFHNLKWRWKQKLLKNVFLHDVKKVQKAVTPSFVKKCFEIGAIYEWHSFSAQFGFLR